MNGNETGKESNVVPSSSPSGAVALETRKIRRLRVLVDLTSALLVQSELPLAEAIRLVQAVRAQALALFPGKDRAYDLIYAPRFARILREKYRIEYPE